MSGTECVIREGKVLVLMSLRACPCLRECGQEWLRPCRSSPKTFPIFVPGFKTAEMD